MRAMRSPSYPDVGNLAAVCGDDSRSTYHQIEHALRAPRGDWLSFRFEG